MTHNLFHDGGSRACTPRRRRHLVVVLATLALFSAAVQPAEASEPALT